MTRGRQLLASELIALLQTTIEKGGDRPVQVSGCDCNGSAGGISEVEYRIHDQDDPDETRLVRDILIERTDD